MSLMISFSLSLSGAQTPSFAADAPGGILPPPPPPDVSAVDLSLAAGSVRFPEGNMRRADLPTQAAVIRQPMENWFHMFNGSGASFAIVRKPRAQRVENISYTLMGGISHNGRSHRTLLRGSNYGVNGDRDRFVSVISNKIVKSPPWDEDSALVVARTSGSTATVGWYSLADGTAHEGSGLSGVATLYLPGSGAGYALSIGSGTGASDPTPGGFGGEVPWAGDIAMVGYVQGDTTQAQWSQVALGANPVDVFGAANVLYLRKLDGAASGYAAPAEAIADATPPAAVWGQGIEPGSHLQRQNPTDALRIDGLEDGWVYGVTPGQTSRAVPLSGTAIGRSGTVEARLVYADTGVVAVDWTDLGPISGGTWSGSVTAPLSSQGWLIAQVRSTDRPEAIAERRSRFGVGYVFAWLGQSQLGIALNTLGTGFEMPPADSLAISYATTDLGSNNNTGPFQLLRLGGREQSDALSAFAAQFRRFDPATPVMVLDAAVHGSSMIDLINDGQGRAWSDLQAKLDHWGNTVTAVLHQWGTADMAQNDYDDILQALYDGTGPRAGDHSLTDALTPGFAFALSPLTRHTGGGIYVGNASQTRALAVDWAETHGHPVGLPVSDFEIEDAGGPHQDGLSDANIRLGARLGILAAKAVGLPTPEQPYFTGTVSRNGTTLTIPVTLPGGGALRADAPGALRSFEVDDGSGWTSSGFTAAINGNAVVLTRASGAWPAGTGVRYLSNLENRADGDGASEAAIMAGALFEAWPDDVAGKGVPVLGTVSDGAWMPYFEAVAP